MGTTAPSIIRLNTWRRVISSGVAAIAAAGLALTVAPPSTAAAPPADTGTDTSSSPVDLNSADRRPDRLASLQTVAEDKGSVRVVVTLTAEARALGELSSARARIQRGNVSDVSDRVRSLAVSKGATVNRTYGGNIPAIALTVTPRALDALSESTSVARIDPDTVYAPSDTWTNQVIAADRAQIAGHHGVGSRVAILDTGVEYDHPAFTGRVAGGACFSGSSSCPNGQTTQVGGDAGTPCTYAVAQCSHGTHVAGIAAGAGTVAGVADQASITPVQVFSRQTCNGNPCASARSSDILAALNWLYTTRDASLSAVNMSLGGGSYAGSCDAENRSLKLAIDNLRSVNVATVVASGNDGTTNAVASPACISTAITVGATDNGDQVASFSNSGEQVDVYAPGVRVESAVPGGSYAYKQGTSMAAPHVAGAVGLMKATRPRMTVEDIERVLASTGPLVTDSKSGLVRHRLDVGAALNVTSDAATMLTNDDVREMSSPPGSGHLFETRSTTAYWSAVAIRPPSSADYDLGVYDSPGNTPLGISTFPGNQVDFVAQDNNDGRRAYPDSTFPLVLGSSGSGRYQIEYANDGLTARDGSQTVSMGTSDLIEIRDSRQEAGVATHYRVVPSDASQDPELFLMESEAGTTYTYVRDRSRAVASSYGAGPGEPESFSHVSPFTQFEGLVLINRSGAGDYTLYRDTTAPAGSVSIDDGAADTTSRDVELSISGHDDQTGVMDMRVSTDGTLDNETWDPFATTTSVTLPEGTGTKTVLVQLRNRAGMVAEPVSDTIVLAAPATVPPRPSVTGSAASAQAVTVAFTPNGDGGSPITRYTVACASTDGGVANSAVGTTSPIRVANLSAGRSYRCRILATNAVGNGPYSANGATVTLPPPTAPPAPTLIASTPSAGAMTVAFRPNGNGGTPITRYTVACASTDGGVANSAVGTTSPIKVVNLSGSMNYRCRVLATNAVGNGPYSINGATTTLPAPTVPPPPTVTSSTPTTGAMTVIFASNGNGGSPITRWTTACASTDGGTARSATSTTTRITVPNLTSGKNYRCRVLGTNAVGNGPYSTNGATLTVP